MRRWSEGMYEAFRLEGTDGFSVTLTNLGASIFSISMPDINGQQRELVLGRDTLREFAANRAYFGATIGRVCSRIRNGKLYLNGKLYQLPLNAGAHHLHGGVSGFDKKLWDAEVSDNSVVFRYVSADGEESYPGQLCTCVKYSVEGTSLAISYDAVSDQDTPVALTNHTYFNLNGGGKIYDNILKLYCRHYLDVGADRLPTGQILLVNDTPMDFLQPKRIGDGILSDFGPIRDLGGYDAAYLRTDAAYGTAAELYAPATGILLRLETSLPSIQLYTAGDLCEPGRNGEAYHGSEAVCLEAQPLTDSNELPFLRSIILPANQRYSHQIRYCFALRQDWGGAK